MRRIGAGALFRDGLGGVLLVKPSYKSHWEIPGGVVEPEEAPRACCRRELREELGLEIEVGRLLVVDWLPPEPPRPEEGWMFVYDGGVLLAGVTRAIRLPAEELLEWRFVTLDDIDGLVSESKARRLRMAHECALEGTTADLEWGFPSFQNANRKAYDAIAGKRLKAKGIHHVQICIPPGTEDQARDFYCGVLGLTETPKPQALRSRGGLWVEIGDQQLHIGVEGFMDRAATKAHVAYLVDDLNVWKQRLQELGIEVMDGVEIPGFIRAELRDPFGNRVELIQPD